MAVGRPVVRGCRRRTDHPGHPPVPGPAGLSTGRHRQRQSTRCVSARAATHLRHRTGQCRGQRLHTDEPAGPRIHGHFTALRGGGPVPRPAQRPPRTGSTDFCSTPPLTPQAANTVTNRVASDEPMFIISTRRESPRQMKDQAQQALQKFLESAPAQPQQGQWLQVLALQRELRCRVLAGPDSNHPKAAGYGLEAGAPPVFVLVAPNYCRARFISIDLARKEHRTGQGSDRQNDRTRDDHELPNGHTANATPVCPRRIGRGSGAAPCRSRRHVLVTTVSRSFYWWPVTGYWLYVTAKTVPRRSARLAGVR